MSTATEPSFAANVRSRPPSRRPKVLVAVTLSEVGGAQTCVAELLPSLASRYEVVVAASGNGPLRGRAEAAGARWVSLRHMRRAIGIRDALALLELVRLIRRERPSIVHAHSAKAGILARLAAAACGVPCRLFTSHGWAFRLEAGLRGGLYLWAERLAGKASTLVICPSADERRAGVVARCVPPEMTVIVPTGIDVATRPQRRHAQVARPTIVSIGRMKRPKDFASLVAAGARTRPARLQLVLVGDGPDRPALEREVERLALGDTVTFAGEREDVAALLAAADVFVLSSTSECLPVSILEAMAAGLPVVATAVGGVPELVRDGETGILVPPQDADALAAALGRLAADVELRAAFGAAGRRRALERFERDRYLAAHLALYESQLAQHQVGATA